MYMNRDFKNLVNSTLLNSSSNWGTGVILQHPQTHKILLAKRVDNHLYGTPGGKVEYQESPLTGVIRECKEESNIDINNIYCYGIHFHTSPSGKDWISFLFYSDDFDDSKIKNQPSEMDQWDWYTLSESLKLNLFPPCLEGIKQAKELGLLDGTSDSNNYIPFLNCPKSASEAMIGTPCQYSLVESDPIFEPKLVSPWLVWD